ncbi:MAG: tripartite tricarboxylate transporter permease [Bradyrhizobium sp.]
MFGIAEFLNSINNTETVDMKYAKVGISDMFPSKADLKLAFWPMIRGTFIGSLCALIPGTGPTIASFVSYATEKKISKTPERFGHGAIEGVACPEASTHLLCAGRLHSDHEPGHSRRYRDGAIVGRAHHSRHRSRPATYQPACRHLLGLIASFWIGNILLVILNVPMIGLWVKLLSIPYRYLYPSAMFFVCIGGLCRQ